MKKVLKICAFQTMSSNFYLYKEKNPFFFSQNKNHESREHEKRLSNYIKYLYQLLLLYYTTYTFNFFRREKYIYYKV